MHKNPIKHEYGGYLENTYPQDNYGSNYGEYLIGINEQYPSNYISKFNVGQYTTSVGGYGYTMTLIRPIIEYKE